MAKKKKRYRKAPPSRRVQRPIAAPASEGITHPEAGSPPMQGTRFAAAARSAAPRDWAHEYRYVIQDLRRMAITSAAMFALLFVLAIVVPFFLR